MGKIHQLLLAELVYCTFMGFSATIVSGGRCINRLVSDIRPVSDELATEDGCHVMWETFVVLIK